MKIHDITLPISPLLPVWPGDPAISITKISSFEKGDHSNVSHYAAGVHVGTHIDAPNHFLEDGLTLESIPLERLIGDCVVIEIPIRTDINRIHLIQADIPHGTKKLLIKTLNSAYWESESPVFTREFSALSQDAAKWVVEMGIELVGIDYLSIAPFGNSTPTHQVLLKANIVVVEGLNLSLIRPGHYRLFCLPMNLMNVDGAPARAILIED